VIWKKDEAMSRNIRSLRIASFATALFLSGASVAGTGPAQGSGNDPSVTAGRAAVYQQLSQVSLERVSTPDSIKSITMGNVGVTEIWTTLEHGEKVECLDCIPGVAKMLYDGNAKTREISAWWLRRRVFGVFGQGEVYSKVVTTLTTDPSEARRSYAAEALGEFLVADGIPLVATAATTDTSALVRTAAVKALMRLNDEGPNGELGAAISDAAPEVRLAALAATVRINVFTHVDLVAGALSDGDANVRRRAAEVLGTFQSTDAVAALIALTSPETEKDARVRTSAVAALGRIADPSARDAVNAALSDPDALVQSVARIAARRL
jgi:HEAT repeat protein